MAALVKRWHSLNASQKEYWNTVAKQGGRKRTTGFNMFIRDGMLKAGSETEKSTTGESVRETRRCVRIVRPRGGKRTPLRSRAVASRAPT